MVADGTQPSRVRIVGHDPSWGDVYSAEVESIRAAASTARLFIDHVGSTAVPALASKPVIDVWVSLVAWADADKVCTVLADLGYSIESERDDPQRRFLVKTIRHGSLEAIHLHLTPTESEWGTNMLVFRDELRADSSLAERYASLKRELATKHPTNPDGYTADKGDFIRQALQRAKTAFSNDRLLTSQRAELDRAQSFQLASLAAQFAAAVLAAVSVYSSDNSTQFNFALTGFFIAAVWFVLARKERVHRAVGDQARRVVLLASGLNEHFPPALRRRIFNQFTVSVQNKPIVREEDYFASRSGPGYRRLAELIEESAYWTRDLQQASANVLLLLLAIIVVLIILFLWATLPTLPSGATVSIARVLVTLLVFLLTSNIVGAALAHLEATNTIGEILQRVETSAARSHPAADVLLLMSDYNAAVEGAPFALPLIFRFRRHGLARRWRSYLENKRRWS